MHLILKFFLSEYARNFAPELVREFQEQKRDLDNALNFVTKGNSSLASFNGTLDSDYHTMPLSLQPQTSGFQDPFGQGMHSMTEEIKLSRMHHDKQWESMDEIREHNRRLAKENYHKQQCKKLIRQNKSIYINK